MAGAVFTTRFVIANTPNVWVTYTVPAGYRAVLRNVVGRNGNAAQQECKVHVAGYVCWDRVLPALTGFEAFETRVVAYAGEQIAGWVPVSGAVVIASGYLFADPAIYDASEEPITIVDEEPVGSLPWTAV